MIKPESLDFPPLHCSLDQALGDYYLDNSAAIRLVESGYHGRLDGNGVPLVFYPGQGFFHNAITTAQYALGNMTAVRRGDVARGERARMQVDSLVASQEQSGSWTGCWLMAFSNPRYRWLRAPWASALACGQAISALLRAWELFGEERYRASAEAAYRGLHDSHAGAPLCREAGDELWYEEYPAEPPLHVLNGHVYTLLGVLDYARVSGDAQADVRWRRAASTVLAHLREFDLGYWSAYELRWREPVSVHYQKNIHAPQLRVLARLTGETAFDAMADRWERYAHSLISRGRWAAAVRIHRWRRR